MRVDGVEPLIEKMIREENDYFTNARDKMVRQQILDRGIVNHRVLEAMTYVHRHEFVPFDERLSAYADIPLSIGFGQTISQPFMVGLMTSLVNPSSQAKVLEIGTGSGYQTAVLAYLAKKVFTIEAIEELNDRAKTIISDLGVNNVWSHHGNGYLGWAEEAPFDCIVVTAAPPEVPEELLRQLRPGGRMVVPVGEQGAVQNLQFIQKTFQNETMYKDITQVQFVPMVHFH